MISFGDLITTPPQMTGNNTMNIYKFTVLPCIYAWANHESIA